MAGGRGTRMYPLTEILPKPLIPVGDKTMIEHVIEQFDTDNITIIVNYMANLIEAYFPQYNIIKEDRYLGTAGALKLLTIKGDFIMSNCDILVDAGYNAIYDKHVKNNADMTIVATRKISRLPYGTFDYSVDNRVLTMSEKPEMTSVINTGFYIINSRVIEDMPDGQLDMNDLIQMLVDTNKRVFLHHIKNDKYTDIGTLEDYKKYMEVIK